jgi:hypothetical protein
MRSAFKTHGLLRSIEASLDREVFGCLINKAVSPPFWDDDPRLVVEIEGESLAELKEQADWIAECESQNVDYFEIQYHGGDLSSQLQ